MVLQNEKEESKSRSLRVELKDGGGKFLGEGTGIQTRQS